MKKSSFILLIILFIVSCSSEKEKKEDSKAKPEIESGKDTIAESIPLEKSANDTNFISGDVIFQTSLGHQSDLVSIVTQSPFSHCGIILQDQNGYQVLEANGTVKKTPLQEWIQNGKDGKYVVMRFKYEANYQSKEYRAKAIKAISEQLNKPYDSKFLWKDDQMYCSELVWKLYVQTTDRELCPLKKLKEYDLSSDEVKKELTKRYGQNIPLEEKMVSPADLAASEDLNMIFSNY